MGSVESERMPLYNWIDVAEIKEKLDMQRSEISSRPTLEDEGKSGESERTVGEIALGILSAWRKTRLTRCDAQRQFTAARFASGEGREVTDVAIVNSAGEK